MDIPISADTRPGAQRRWFLRGMRKAFSIPGLILAISFVGFAGLAAEAHLTLGEAVFMTGIVWALPAQVVMLGAIMSGLSLPATALAVCLSSIRLMPMVMVLVPELRGSRTPRAVLYALSHFVAVTSWVLALATVRQVPRDCRAAYYAGLGVTLTISSMAVVAATFAVTNSLPPVLGASLLLLTPLYFLTSLWASSRERAARFAMLFGMALGPVCHMLMPKFDLLAAGLGGGAASYAVHRLAKTRAPA